MAKNNVTGDILKLSGRASFLQVWRPKRFGTDPNKEPTFQATVLLDPSDAKQAKMISEIKQSFIAVCKEAFGGHKGVKRPFGLADKHKKKKDYDGYKGMFYLEMSNTTRPTLCGRMRQDLVEGDGILYSGCYINTNPTLWTWMHETGGEGVSANLRIIQFVKDGEAFGNAPAKADEELDDVEIDDDDAVDDWDDNEEEDDLD
jgi:hypothetical protein